jgi:parvulin-like peptidyl-prolyl isomerase
MQKITEEASKNAAIVSDAEIEKFYADNPDKFALPERARMAHILLQIPQGATAVQKEEIRKRLESIRVDIEAEIITFADAAAKYSQDEKTASRGGDMGFVTRGNLPKAFADALFNRKPSSVSPAMESQAGYHILKMLEFRPAEQATFEEAKPALRQSLEANAKQSAQRKFVEELKSKTVIEYFMTAEEFAKRRE